MVASAGPAMLTHRAKGSHSPIRVSNGTFYFRGADNDWTSPQNNALWQDAVKTLFDPCPVGWRVPKGGPADNPQNPWTRFTTENSQWTGTNPDMGRYWNTAVSYPFPAWYPVTGYRHWITGYFAMCGVEISNWTTARDDKNYYLFSNSVGVDPGGFQGGYAVPSIGFPVRCIRE